MSAWNEPSLIKLFTQSTPLVDVRAPIEFDEGIIPFSTNLPIMSNEERAQVGTTYKKLGQAEAIKLGHELVSGKIKEGRVALWSAFLRQHPGAQVFCFRGGLRSQITCQWLREAGHDIYPIQGGYKRLRRFFISWLDEAPFPSFYRLGGFTGTGKTTLLHQFSNAIDLEGLANHRGSSFGFHGAQPSQISFENKLALDLMKLRDQKNVMIEDESVTLGRIRLPSRFFTAFRNSPLVILRVDEEKRIENIFKDYVIGAEADFFLQGLIRIKKRFSSADFESLTSEIKSAFSRGHILKDHQNWISMLLNLYYDPVYEKDLKRNSHLIQFQGNESEVRDFYQSLFP